MRYIERTLGATLRQLHDIFPVITLTGPRQSGKSTLCRHLYPELPYVNFENVLTGKIFRENPVGYVDSFKGGAIFDEVQLEPELFRAMQTVVDEDRFTGAARKFILTGSSNFSIMAKVSESMAGRKAPLTLLPLSVKEILDYKTTAATTVDLMFYGGYPLVWVLPESAAELIIQSYVDTYVERDLRQLINIKDLNKFIKFLGLCAGRIGTELN